jgi:hypothetical protein
MMVDTLDLKTDLKSLLKPSAKAPEIVDVPPMQYLMIDGAGDPNTAAEYAQAVEALYTLAYGLKFHFKKTQGITYPVMQLEGLWWAEDMSSFLTHDKSSWLWTMMIMQPDIVTAEAFEQQRAEAAKKKPLLPLAKVRLEMYHEGLSAQIMHIGPYAAEAPTIQKLHQFIADQGYSLSGKHHELYLGDPRKSAPEKLKTIIRQPMRKP